MLRSRLLARAHVDDEQPGRCCIYTGNWEALVEWVAGGLGIWWCWVLSFHSARGDGVRGLEEFIAS